MIRRGSVGLAFAAVLAGTVASSAQGVPDRGAFVMRAGGDTVVIEHFTRAGDTIRGSIGVKGQPRQEYLAVLGRDFSIASLALDVFAANAAADASPTVRVHLAMRNDSAIMETAGNIQRFSTPGAPLLLINNSFALAELFTRKAKASGGAATIAAWAPNGAATITVGVVPVGTDSVLLTLGGQVERLRVDNIGRILGGAIPAQQIEVSRVEPAKAATLGRSPQPVAEAPLPMGLTERALTVPGPIPLPGLLTLPAGKGPFPGVILVHGSGAGDRDETVAGNKPFRDIAWGLAQAGIAVLRYDKRAHVAPTWGMNRPMTVYDEAIQDALSALNLLRQQPEIAPARSYLIGHSLGAMLAPRIAKEDGKLAGVIIMAGATTMPLAVQMDRQFNYLVSVSGVDSARERKALEPTWAAVRQVLKLVPADTVDTKPIVALGWTTNKYWLDLAAYNSAVVMRDVHIPSLVLQGMHDWKVPPDQLEGWLAAVGPRADLTVKRYPGLNHLFIAGTGPSLVWEEATVGHVDTQVIADIAAFIRPH